MKRVAAAVALIGTLAVPGLAKADSSTDAALGLGAFAVFNQILSGTGVFGGGRTVFVAPPPPPPVVYSAPPRVVYAPRPVVVYPAPPVVYRAPAVVYAPAPAYGYYAPRPPAYGYYAPVERHGHWKHAKHHWKRQHRHHDD
jgi:hypothetical protein